MENLIDQQSDPSSDPAQGAVEERDHDGKGTGLEKEIKDNISRIERPFKPEKIKISRATPNIQSVMNRIRYGEIDLSPEFQRKPGLWSLKQASRLIESLLLRIPLPAFYMASDKKENWAVVDGLQRLSTIFSFVEGKFALTGLEYLLKFENHSFENIPRLMQRRIEETALVVNVIEPGTPEEVMFNVFRRINTGGLILNGQEIRNALNRGPARDLLRDLAKSKEFLRATVGSISDKRMGAQECVLRFMAFWLTHFEEYKVSDLDGFLNSAMRRINELSDKERDECKSAFTNAMKAAFAIFEDNAFRKRYAIDDSRRPINKSLFETWSVCLAGLSTKDTRKAIMKKDLVNEKFMDLLVQDREYEASISTSTDATAKVRKRFKTTQNLLKEVLQA